MPYLDPADVLRQFSSFAREEVRPALADDERFVAAQVGSMASTLRYLAAELDGTEAAVETQREALDEALDAAIAALRTSEAPDATAALDDVVDARDRAADAEGDAREVEATLLAAADEALSAVDAVEGEAAARARQPLYGFLDARLDEQLRMLGRDDE
ncbi:MAG: hypothetical protein ABEJ06_05125 [Haloarculaceae archaeon]